MSRLLPTNVRTVLLLGLAAIASSPVRAAEAWPAVPGAVFAVRDADIRHPVVAFDAKGRGLLAFHAAARGRALVGRHFEFVCDGGSFHAGDAGAWIGRKVGDAKAFTLEVVLVPAVARPPTTGVILAFGDDDREDVALVQTAAGLGLRLGGGEVIDLFAVEAGRPVHVVLACGAGRWAAFRDGKPAADGPLPEPTAWGERELVMGAGWSGAEPWRGRLEAVAVHPRALSSEEAAAEATAAAILRAGRRPARQVRFRGTLVRQADTTDVAAMRPYSRSMTAAEYRIDELLAGEWADPTITVLHWMVMDNQRLPLADRKPGATVELVVEPLDDHPQLESSRRDELTDGDLAAEVFYCETEASR
jgi:hypothetical protein